MYYLIKTDIKQIDLMFNNPLDNDTYTDSLISNNTNFIDTNSDIITPNNLDINSFSNAIDSLLMDSLLTAKDLGTISDKQQHQGNVSPVDRRDFYYFQTDKIGDLDYRLTGLSANANIQLLDSNGDMLSGSFNPGKANEYEVHHNLPAGEYYLKVYGYLTDYNLNVELLGDPDKMNSFLTAKDLGTLSGKQTQQGTVSKEDRLDLYHFRTDETGDLEYKVTGLSSNANIQLLDSNGDMLSGSFNPGTVREYNVHEDLPEGDYYLKVYGGGTNYNLDFELLGQYDFLADVPAEDLIGLAEGGLDFAEVNPQTLASIDFNNIPAEDFQILKQAGLSIESLSFEDLADINLGVLQNFDYLTQIELSLTSFDESSTFAELSSTFASNPNLFSYKSNLDIASGLNLDNLNQLSLSDFQALDYAYLADGAFDSEFYLQEYEDVRNSGVNPFTDYGQNGQLLRENRYPNPVFKSLVEADEILVASANTDFQLVKDVAATFDESETVEIAFVPAIPVIYYTVAGAVAFTILGLEVIRQANSWDEAFEQSDFEYYFAPESIIDSNTDVNITGRFPQPVPEVESPLTTPEFGGDTEVDTGTPPFDLESGIEVNVLDFPNASEYLQDLLDGKFEFPLEDEGSPYFLAIETNEILQDLINDSTLGDETKGPSTIYYHDFGGGFAKANEIFNSLNLSDVKEISDSKFNGRVGKLDDGRKVVVRNGSKGDNGFPTLEIQKGKRRTKFRF